MKRHLRLESTSAEEPAMGGYSHFLRNEATNLTMHRGNVFLTLIVAGIMVLNSGAQSTPNADQFGEKYNTGGANLVVKEAGRDRSDGQTIVTYNLIASGLPKDSRYTLWTQTIGSEPQPAADALLNEDGKAVSQIADSEHNVAEDPIDLRVVAGRGEPKQFGLISIDGKFRAFARVVPFPIEVSDGPCHLSAVMTAPNYSGVIVTVTGLQRGEDLLIKTRSDHEGGERNEKATDSGAYLSLLLPFVKGKRSGRVQFDLNAKSCTIGIELPWGEGSYKLQ